MLLSLVTLPDPPHAALPHTQDASHPCYSKGLESQGQVELGDRAEAGVTYIKGKVQVACMYMGEMPEGLSQRWKTWAASGGAHRGRECDGYVEALVCYVGGKATTLQGC